VTIDFTTASHHHDDRPQLPEINAVPLMTQLLPLNMTNVGLHGLTTRLDEHRDAYEHSASQRSEMGSDNLYAFREDTIRPQAPVIALETKWKDAHSQAIVKSTDSLSILAQILANGN
jgi:hypothetical protein